MTDWKKIQQLRSNGMRSLHDILTTDDPDNISSPEEVVLLVAGSMSILKWKVLGMIHDLGRYQILQHFVSFASKDEGEERPEGKAKFVEGAAEMLKKTMKKEDHDIFQDVMNACEAFASLSGIVCHMTERFGGSEAFEEGNLDYASVFASGNLDPCLWTKDMLGDQEFVQEKFQVLRKICKRSFNQGEALTPEDRSGLEEALVGWLGFVAPVGIEQEQPTQCFGLTSYGSMNSLVDME